ncbi:ATP-binding protein [Bacteroides faecium]|uniref:ATP-binding protein n=1 Tax=Bacteroides faecium TaxID=2715212 RepID=A0A6H0KHP3_9BACE|nr:ATP-binding protein [Bacteroides faecium]QIU92912.1 ATP-binding protein [Bacteroides faecium]
MEKLIQRFQALLAATDTSFLRYSYQSIDWNDRMTAIIGARGIGKTTLLLQHIKLNLSTKETLYVSADDFYFAEHRLLDFAEEFHKMGGKYLFVDEIHKYIGWSKEMKLIYDYLPNLHITFTGSSILDIFKGTDDLSRRVLLYRMHGMSFREYLNMHYHLDLPAYSLEQILNQEVGNTHIEFPLAAFKEYLKNGYYPFANQGNYEERLLQIINTVLETDIPLFARLNASTAIKMKRLMAILAQSVPFKPNYSKLAEIIGIDRQTLSDYITYIEKAGLLKQLYDETKGVRGLGKVTKLYLENTNLAYVLGKDTPDIGNLRETFFFNQLAVMYEVAASSQSDFQVDGYTFEIGGRNKGNAQIQGLDKAYVVKDDIEYGFGNTIPLWHFGFLY